MDGHQHGASFRVPVVGSSFLCRNRIHLLLLVLLSVAFKKLVGQFGMIDDDLLLSHVLDGFICVALNRIVVLVDFNAEATTSGEVVGLGKVTESMMLHCLKDVVNAHPLASLAQSFFSSLRPDLIEAGNDEGSSLDLKDHLQLAVHNLAGDLGLTHVEDL